jgi:CDP-paratose 2-epimerase
MTERLLILGGAGFVGSALAIGLKTEFPGWDVVCFDNLRRRGSELNLARLRAHQIRFVHGDVRNLSDLDPGVLGVPGVVIDCSAEPSVLAGITSPQYVLQTNLLGTINVLELCRQNGARLVFLSTSRVYSIPALKRLRLVEEVTRLCLAPEQSEAGASAAGIAESFSVQGTRSLYGTTKLASEMLIEEYREAFGLQAIINRCGVLTGPWQMGKVDQGVFVLWMAAHYFQKKLEYIGFGGTGKQVRDLLHVDDLLHLVKHELENFDRLDGEVFNVGGGSDCSLSLLETTELCREISGRTAAIIGVAQERPADVPLFITDNSKVSSRTGWSPKRGVRDILQDIHRWIRENEQFLKPILS